MDYLSIFLSKKTCDLLISSERLAYGEFSRVPYFFILEAIANNPLA